MRISSPQLGLAPKSVLGGEVFDREILLGLAKAGIKVDILLPRGTRYDKNIRNWKVKFLPISHFPAILFNFFILPYFYHLNRTQKIRIIRIHQPQFIGIGSLLFKIFNPQTKLVATFHQFRETKMYGLEKFIHKKWDHIICDSLYVKEKISNVYKISPKKITVGHNGVPKYLKPMLKDKKMLEKLDLHRKFVLLFMGLFIERKNPLFLIDVLNELVKSKPDLVLMFWGKGPQKNKILEKSKQLNLTTKIRIIDPLYGKDKNMIHNLADIFVHPAIDEGFALAPLEAMACAKPVFITKGFSASEAVDDGVNGRLCLSNNIGEWTKNLLEVINNSFLRKRMGRASILKVKGEFQWKYAVEKHIQVFNKLDK